jgi:transcriptional regulator with XRE-family HTH domain
MGWYLFVTVNPVTADELKRKRERLGLTQAELAKRLGITKITILRYENGQTEIPRVVELAMKEIERELK